MNAETTAAPMPPDSPPGLAFTKGHGTENDFVLVADPDGTLDLDPGRVARICDRRAGVGADGLIRVVRSSRCPDAAAALADDSQADWFMDYRNADGSPAQMCGNGIRVLVEFLVRRGWVEIPAPGGRGLAIASRSGVKYVTPWPAGGWCVRMGSWSFPGGADAVAAGHDATVHVRGMAVSRPALSVDLGNPHTVALLGDLDELAAVDLGEAPVVDPDPPHGSNVELAVMLEPGEDDHGPFGRIAMRVHERGVGETRSCGTGACATALAARAWGGEAAPDRWLIDVPGGQVEVTATTDGEVLLAGPAVLVAEGVTTL